MRVGNVVMTLALSLALGATSAYAQYPDRPITLVVPFAAGGANDSVARHLANAMGPILGQSVIVENRPGGGTTIGSASVAKAKADGYTLLLVSPAHAINPHILKRIPYRALEDFTPISQITRSAYVLVTSQASRFERIEDLVAAGAAPNGQVTYASSGTGSAPHLAGQLFATLSRTKAVHVPYQGGAPALIGVLRGDVDMYFSSVSGARAFIESKQVRALGVSGDQRVAMLPDLPTIAELGISGFSINGWYGLAGPANLPDAVIERLNAAATKALTDPTLISRLRQEGEETAGSTPQAFETLLRKEVSHYSKIVADSGLQPQ